MSGRARPTSPGSASPHYGTSGTYWLIGNGTAWATADAAFNGRIDEVAIYCGNWTPDVWTHHYETGRPPVCGTADFDGDGDSGTDADIEAFFACIGGNCCPTCGTADFDADGDSGTDADIEAFFRVLGGGNC